MRGKEREYLISVIVCIVVVFTRDGITFTGWHNVCPTEIAFAAMYFLIKQSVPGVTIRFQYRTAH